MKAYQWLTLSAAIVITGFEAGGFTNASRIVSPIETQTTVAASWTDAAGSLTSESTGSSSASKSGEAR